MTEESSESFLETHPVGAYRGSAWNSRFLYAPKVSLELDKWDQFIALRELADIKLGVKTGSDKFFFLTESATPAASSSHRQVIGFRGWEGALARADLQVAVRNPRDLTKDGKRVFRTPKNTGTYYLYPTGAKRKAELSDYIALGESAQVDRQPLVRSNATEDWYVQVRGIVKPDWILPYNSAYEYGATENTQAAAVINGRFIGVTPKDGIDSELLGAALNTTMTLVMRLLEGVPTGTEGALDIGPPAAKLMKVPDVRKMYAPGADAVHQVVQDLRRRNEMPPAPDRDGRVSEHRRRLDDAVLRAVGLGPGESALFLDRLYSAYGRWRTNVEDVELRMRANRRTTSRLGLSRAESPVLRIGRRIWSEIRDDFLTIPVQLFEEGDTFDTVEIASSYSWDGEDAIFGEGLVPDGKGNVIDLTSAARLEYGLLLRDLNFGRTLEVIRGEKRAEDIVIRSRAELSRFRDEVRSRARQFVDEDKIPAVADAAERLWIATCRDAYRRHFVQPEVTDIPLEDGLF